MTIIRVTAYDPMKGMDVDCGQFDDEEKVFIKFAEPNHYMRKYSGYGISESAIEALKELGCKSVRIHQLQSGEVKEIKFEAFLFGFKDNAGAGPQRFVPWRRMSPVKSRQLELFDKFYDTEGGAYEEKTFRAR